MEKEVKPNKFKQVWHYFIAKFSQTSNGMAIGLFGTLIIGTIIAQFAKIPGLEIVDTWATAIKGLMGAGIGLGVALSLKRNGVTLVASMAAGMIGNYAFSFFDNSLSVIGDPLSCYVSSILCLLAIKLINRKKTPVDLLLIPLVGLIASILYSLLLAYFVHYITIGISDLIKVSFEVVPWLMAIIVSVLVGMALTAPISSVAICVAISIGTPPSLAAGAALIGCCTQMIGFAIEAIHDNKWGSVLAIAFGTSMLEFKNIVKKPIIWLPTIIASACLAPFAVLFNFQTDSVGAGMGTSGLVGLLNTFSVVNYDGGKIMLILAFTVVAPAILVFLIDLLFRKVGWIKKGDFSLQDEI
jgi:uncharacterized membrane protein